MIDYSVKTVVGKYLHVMIGATVYHGRPSYARKGAEYPIPTLRTYYKRGATVLVRAAEYSYERLDSAFILENIGAVCGCTNKEFIRELEKYSAETLASDKFILSHTPHKGEYPTAAELIDFIIDMHRREFYKLLINRVPVMNGGFEKRIKDMTDNLYSCYATSLTEFHRFQLRLYSFSDVLVEKKNFTEFEPAKAYGEKRIGDISNNISRYVIRTNSLFSAEWLICGADGNRDADIKFVRSPSEWKMTFYDSADVIMKSFIYRERIPTELLKTLNRSFNAQYYVISCRGSDEEAFTVQYFSVDNSVRKAVLSDEIVRAAENTQAHRSEIYRDMFAEDREESLRMIADGYSADSSDNWFGD